MKDKIDAVIVDDEQNNIDALAYFLNKYCPSINIVGKALTKEKAIQIITETNPQLIFLDVILDEGTGFDLLDEIDNNQFRVVFVSAFDEFAIKAFKFDAIDYILKPIQIDELILAVNKANDNILKKNYSNKEQLKEVFEELYSAKKDFDFIAVTTLDKIEFVKVDSIVYLESDGRYTTLHLHENKTILATKNLGEFEKMVDEKAFFRIHHGYIVNVNYVLNINKAAGNYCEMSNGKLLPVAKRRQERLMKFLKIR